MSRRIPHFLATCMSLVTLGAFALAQPAKDESSAPGRNSPRPRSGLLKKKAAMPVLKGLKIERDLTYAKVHGDRALKLDLYVPEDAPEKLPLVVWIHGGGWRKGSKSPTAAARLAMNGFVVASVQYRLSDEAKFPAQIEDCKAALRWLRANAKTYHIDPDHVGAWGSSAGGHLVALLGTAGDMKSWDVGEHLDQSSRVQAVCDFFGPADFTRMPVAQADKADGSVALLLGGPVSEKSDAARAASPIAHISKEDPPFLICHGTEDPLVPLKQSVSFHEALIKAGVNATLIKVEGAGHGFRGETDPTPAEVQNRVREFFEAQLKAKP